MNQRLAVCLTGLAALTVTGCGPRTVITELPRQEQDFRYLVMAYTQAATDLGRSPKSAEELTRYLRDFGDPEALLRSPRDGQPYVIVGDVDFSAALGGEMPVIAYERNGVDGVHRAVDLRMAVRDLSATEVAGLAARKRLSARP